MISKATIQAVLERADIVRVVEQSGVRLEKRGAGYVACCPFHSERTPSFHVNPARQTWHCFGACQEGGDVLSYVMKRDGLTFVNAVRKLAEQYGVDLDEEPETDTERERRLKREALLGLNDRVARFYAERLHDNADPAAIAARQYAKNRWGEEYMEEAGMGYAPASGSALYEWARQRGENTDFLFELGLLGKNEQRGTVYDFYRARLVVPIRDKQRRTVGFTARDVTGQSEAKYLNSRESPAYSKREHVFGIDIGWRAALKKDQWLLVEGAPDAMKLHALGFDNAVAPLGGEWTREQLKALAKTTRTVCFLNDADPVPAGQRWGAGIGFVLKNGRKALEMGFTVSVREIAVGEGNTKQDPDSYFTGPEMMATLEEVEFVSWAARKLWDKEGNINQKSDTVRQIAELASFITDETRTEMVLDELIKLRKGKEFWRSNINRAKWARIDAQKKSSQEVDLRKYGFTEDRGCYYGLTDQGEVQWSNFTLRPLFHVRSEDKPLRLFELRDQRGEKELLVLDMDDLNSLQRFRKKLEGMGNYLFQGNENDMLKLKAYLYEQTETAAIIHKMGYHRREGFYVFSNGVYTDGQFVGADTYGIVRCAEEGKPSKCFFLPMATHTFDTEDEGEGAYSLERRFTHRTLNNVPFADYMEKFCRVWGQNGRVGLLYWLASCFRDIIQGCTSSFPILNLFGPKGTGKSHCGSSLMTFFTTGNRPPNLRNATLSGLNEEAGYSVNAMVHFDEYKNQDMKPQILEFMKGAYDGVGRVKMGGTDYKDRKMTLVKSGVIISGQEMPTLDIALFHRCIFLMFTQSVFTHEESTRLAELEDIQRFGCTRYTLDVQEQRPKVQAGFAVRYSEILRRMADESGGGVETRILENWAKLLAVFRCIEGRLPFPFTFDSIYEECMPLMLRQNQLSGDQNELAHFWRTVMFLRDNGDLLDRGDYIVRSCTSIATDVTQRTFGEPRKVLLLNVSRIFQLYKDAARRAGDKIIPDDALREYIKHTDYFLGYVRSVRFRAFQGGYEVKSDSGAPVYRITRAMALDYDLVCEKYGVSLEGFADATPHSPGAECCLDSGGAEPAEEEKALPF